MGQLKMKELIDNSTFNPMSEEICDVIVNRTGNDSYEYYRVTIAFFLTQIASSMRAKIKSTAFVPKPIPVNTYVCALMPSGAGKGYSQSILEEEVVSGFRRNFIDLILPNSLESNLAILAQNKHFITGLEEGDILKELQKESSSYGVLPYAFDSGTGAGFKQIRAKAQLCDAGALNFICDEIGSNLVNNSEITAIGLEMYDLGKIKSKLIKNSTDNTRYEDRDDPVPVNMLWFGTPAKLLNSGKEEDTFYSLLQEGYARRMLFGTGVKTLKNRLEPEKLYEHMLKTNTDAVLPNICNKLKKLATSTYLNKVLNMNKDEEILLLRYKNYCEDRCIALPEHDEIRKGELANRYWKALKLAGVYAFIDEDDDITADHLLQAFKLVEMSGDSLDKILNREKPYAKLAKYVAEIDKPINQADLQDALPFFKGSNSVRQDMLNLASAWGYSNGIVVKTYKQSEIDFVRGERLEKTDLNKLIFSVSTDVAYNYDNLEKPFNKLAVLGSTDNLHWCNHHCMEDVQHKELGNRRNDDFIKPGFNLLVLDLDDGTAIDFVQEVLKEYTYLCYTTKRHTSASHRCRVILPLAFKMYLTKEDYKEFMTNIFDFFPFGSMDTSTGQRSKKWCSNNGTIFTNEGELFDPRSFIPDTTQNNERIANNKAYGNVDSITRWFLSQIKVGNRNDYLYRFGVLLKDKGLNQELCIKKVIELNSKIESPIDKQELESTVISSISNAYLSL